jgi:HSP20 family protein
MEKEFRRDVNYYKVLQVDPGADPLIIKNAYYTILNQLKCHPDKGGDLEKAKLINEAYHILSSAELREEYDRFWRESAEIKYSRSFEHPYAVRVVERQRYRQGYRRSFLEELFLGNEFCGDWLNEFFGMEGEQEYQAGSQSWNPPVNISWAGNNFIIKIELPGVKWEDIHIQFEGGILTIYGEKIEEHQHWVKLEFQYGRFRRSFQLPEQVKPDKINASLRDGILEVRIPIREKNRGRIIPINQL